MILATRFTNIPFHLDYDFSFNGNPVTDEYFVFEPKDTGGCDLDSTSIFFHLGLQAFGYGKKFKLATDRKYNK